MKKVLIFGVGGFVGNYLSQEFISNRYEVYGSDIVKTNSIPNEVKFIEGNLLDANGIEDIVSNIKPNIIVNLAAISSVGASWSIPQTTVQINVVGALNILEAVKKIDRNIKVLLVGSSEEYIISDKPLSEDTPLDASNPYGISKVAQEQFAKLYNEQYDMKVYCVRPFNHTGVGQKDSFVLPSFCKQVAEIEKTGKDGVIKVGNLKAKRDFSHVKDIVRAYRMIVESDDYKTIYNVGSGQAYGLDEILNYIISLSNQNISIEIDKERFRPIDQPLICCDHSLITKNLGWEPKFTVFDAVKELYKYYLDK